MKIKSLVKKFLGKYASDKLFIWATMSYALGYRINLKYPKSFNEKLNWLKLYDHNPIYPKLADKYEAKKLVGEKIGEEHIVPCYAVWDSPEDIDISSLPNQFVIKGTHDSCSTVVCRDKTTVDVEQLKQHFRETQNINYYEALREWVYKEIKPRIIADKFLDDGSGLELQDYKWWCFNGVPRIMYFTNRGVEGQCYENFYDMDFNPLAINHGFPRRVPEYTKPVAFEEMRNLAEKISSGIPFVRVDFFVVKGQVYFGECTFYDWGGGHPFETKEMDLELGKMIQLPIE